MDGIGWKARGDRKPEFNNARKFFPHLKHAVKLLVLVFRLCMFTLNEWWNGREAFIDIFNVFKHFSFTGVPLGGIGCGSIGTDHRMGFNRFSIIPGIKEQTKNIKANQFIVSVHSKTTGSLIYQSLLSAADFDKNTLKCWKTMDPKNVKFRGLFPRAWYEFTLGTTGITVICHQLSPVIPNDYEDTSLPVADFKFEVLNESEEDIDVSIVFTWRNGTGGKRWEDESVCSSKEHREDKFVGRSLNHKIKGMDVTYVIGNVGKGDVTTTTFDPKGDGKIIYNELQKSGTVSSSEPKDKISKQLAIAVCSKFNVSSKSSATTLFSLTWFMPIVHFGMNGRRYKRRYTKFFENAINISKYACNRFEDWNRKIEIWQKPIIEDISLPEWYRSALFNELYYAVDGSTVWFNYHESWKKEEPLISEETERHFEQFGRFGYMESWEYYMINTYDVHYYSSWAFLKNWPQIEMSIQLDFADQVSRIDESVQTSLAEGHSMQVKRPDRIPHDMGHPLTDPWIYTNAYNLHDTSDWKDLNLKFVLSGWRDWKLVAQHGKRSQQILNLLYEKSKAIIDRALTDWDVDKDGMIENSGFADQTYDVWKMTGTSSYCGSLWIASLTVFVEMAKKLNKDEDVIRKYVELVDKSNKVFVEKLWNGSFFAFDEDVSNKKVVMADQLSGFWALLINDDEFQMDKQKLLSSLKVVYEHNVKGYANGEFGAVNGFLTNGKVDESCIQSMEVWSGITYALSSIMIELGMIEEAFKTSEGLFTSIWHRYPLQYQTPEAFSNDGMYRALGYMRPMSIWSIQHSLERKRNK